MGGIGGYFKAKFKRGRGMWGVEVIGYCFDEGFCFRVPLANI